MSTSTSTSGSPTALMSPSTSGMRTGYRNAFAGRPYGDNRPVIESVRRVQGAWYVATGIWPLLSLRSFAAVAGPKPDPFQTRTSGMAYAAAGIALRPWSPAPYDGPTDPTRLLALATSLGTV